MIRERVNPKGIRFFIVFFFIAVFFFIVGFIANRWFFSKDAAKATPALSEKEAAIRKTDSDKKTDDAKKRNPIVGEEKEELTFYKTLQNGKEPPPLKAQKKDEKEQKKEGWSQKQENKPKNTEDKGHQIEGKNQKPDDKENRLAVKKQEAAAKDKKTVKDKIAKKIAKGEPQIKEKRFTLQIAAFKDKDKAEDVAGSLKKKGYEPYIVPVTIPEKGVWYRVRIGKFATRPDAQNIQAKLKNSEGISAFITFTTE